MSRPFRVLIATDSFPPGCGGSGWSTWDLARGLRARGHDVHVLDVDSSPGSAGVSEDRYESMTVTRLHIPAPATPLWRNVVKNERAWSAVDRHLRERLSRAPVDLIHAQHVMTTVASIRTGQALRVPVPVVATVRDYWPVCYWSTLIYDPTASDLCPACTIANMTRCVRPRAGAAGPLAGIAIPYMRRNLRTKRQTLAQADAIIAVSSTIARDLATRAPELDSTKVVTIPNAVDLSAIDVESGARLLEGPYGLYAGKLAPNKGVQFLVDAWANARIDWPLVVAGDGPLRAEIETAAAARGVDLRVTGWLDRTDVWTWMRHAAVLVFPSHGPESLSRVLIEAAALGVPIAAMNTGGTRDILTPDVTALLSTDPHGLASDLRRLASDDRLRASLGAAAREDVRARFSSDAVLARVEDVYQQVVRRETRP